MTMGIVEVAALAARLAGVGGHRVAAYAQGLLKFEKPYRLEGVESGRAEIANLDSLPRVVRLGGQWLGEEGSRQAA
jgi:hypothetical protein